MSSEKTPLASKLTLLVLSLIFVCLVLLVLRAYQRPTPPGAGPSAVEPPAPAVAASSESAASPDTQAGSVRQSASFNSKPAVRKSPASPPSATQAQAPVTNNPPEPANASADSPAAALVSTSETIASSGGSSEIFGLVRLSGTPKPEIPIDLGPACGPLNPNKVTTRHYVVGANNGLANVFVYLKDAKAAPAIGEAPVLDQVGCMYEPYVMGVVTGQKFKVKNSDPTLHNVHNTPKIAGNKEYNIGQALKGQVNEFSFPNREILMRFKCDIHPWMFAYVGVVEHPYFAVTDKDGNFKISGVPDGKYTVVAYHLRTHGANPGLTANVDVKGTARQDFTVELAP